MLAFNLSNQVCTITYINGIINKPKIVAAIIPQNTGTPIARRLSAAAPVATTNDNKTGIGTIKLSYGTTKNKYAKITTRAINHPI